MAITSAIVTAAGVGYSVYAGERAYKNAQKQQAQALATRQSADDAQGSANTTMLTAQAQQRLRSTNAGGRQSTILTGPSGIPATTPPASKTLLGI